MDRPWLTFIPALSSLLGVIIGSLGTFLLQWKQRQWALHDLRLQWKKERLETQVDSLLNLLGQSLTHLRFMAEGLRQGRTDLAQYAKVSVNTVVAASIASITIRDAKIGELFSEYASIVEQIRDLHEQGKLTEQKMGEHLEKAQIIAQKIGEQAEALIVEV